MRSRLHPWVAAFTCLVVGTGCPAEEDPGDAASTGLEGSTGLGATSDMSSTSMGSEDSSGGSPEPACDCVEGAEDFVDFVCDVEEICEPVVVTCDQEPLADCEMAELTVTNPEVLVCHYDALVSGDVALLRWELPHALDPGAAGQRTMVVLNEDREAVIWHESWGAPSYEISDVTLSQLRPTTHFDQCTLRPTAEDWFLCLYDMTEAVLGVCVPAHEFPIG